MKLANKIFLIALVVLLLATVYGLIRTGRESGILAGNGAGGQEQAVRVDQAPLLTAEALASMPTSAAELPFARGALHLGDEEMDLAFALAVLDATQHPPALTAKAKEIQARLQKAEDVLAAEQAHVAQLTTAEAKGAGAKKNKLDDQLKLAQAQLELDQDEVDDEKEELIRAGGGLQDRIQAMTQEHDAASQASDATKVAVSVPIEPHGLIQRFQQWSALHQKQLQLWRAKQEALSAAAALALKDDFLERHLGAQATGAQNDTSTGAGEPGGPPSTPVVGGKRDAPSGEGSATILETTQRRAADRKTLVTLAKRIDNETQLAKTYGQWIGMVAAEQRSLVNGGLRGVLVILAIAIIAVLIDYAIGALVRKTSMDRRQVATLRTATGVTLQIMVVLLILLVIFGRPTQLGTVLGLAGAGLTIALKDFIIGFLGWFVLMGKNGVRLGDWVEINGVTGEVVELGMFPAINVKPIIGGVEISVRYVTRANERSLLRAKLDHAAVDLLGSVPGLGIAPQPDSDSPKPVLISK
jgi:hypothetical protein